MAWSYVSLSTDEQAWAAADKPMLSSNALSQLDSIGPSFSKWIVGTTTGNVVSGNGEDTDNITEFLFDNLPGQLSKPNAADTAFTIYLSRSGSPIEFDWIGIVNHNLDTLACTAFTVEIDNNSLFPAPTQIMSVNLSTALSSDRRYSNLELYHTGTTPLRYSGVAFARVAITCSSGIPQIGQLIFGRRRQLPFQPVVPWDPTSQVSSIEEIVCPSGARDRTAAYKARREMDAVFRHSDSTVQSGISDWWDDINHGAYPFFIHDEPNSSPLDFNMMMPNGAEFVYPWTGPKTRSLQVTSVEQGPTYLSLE